MIETPYLLFLGDAPDALAAKVAQGIRDWRPEHRRRPVAHGRLPGRHGPARHDARRGRRPQGAKTLVVGVANRGGVISPAWIGVLKEALLHGLDLASGLHALLRDVPELTATAMAHHGRHLHDVRVPPRQYPIADGVRRRGKRCLAVGTDCSIGKMYTALAMERAARARRSRRPSAPPARPAS
jgi:hypothetical protein